MPLEAPSALCCSHAAAAGVRLDAAPAEVPLLLLLAEPATQDMDLLSLPGEVLQDITRNFMLEAIKYPLLRRRLLHVHSLAVQILHNWTMH